MQHPKMIDLSSLFCSNPKPTLAKPQQKRKIESATSSPIPKSRKSTPTARKPDSAKKPVKTVVFEDSEVAEEMKSAAQPKLDFKPKPPVESQIAALNKQNATLIEVITKQHALTMELLETERKQALKERKYYMQHVKELIIATREKDHTTIDKFEAKLLALSEKLCKPQEPKDETTTIQFIESKSPAISPKQIKSKEVLSDGDEMFED